MSHATHTRLNVSVVIPTYSPDEGLDRLVRSLEAQTMPASEFEIIFVDDGSPDPHTWPRLQRIRDSHDNVRIERIDNSGWPSRPRNIGLELARGEYVLFMDHDDELYPQALQAGYAMAARTGADVLNGKETRTDQSSWGIDTYRENLVNAVDRTDLHPLIPTNPHKLFRRALLMEHGVRFPEGRRVLWEDVFFALDLAPHVKVISVLADTPFYHWVRGRKTASSSYQKDRAEYWRWVREIVLQTNAKLAGPALQQQWRLMLLHQYRSRVLGRLGPALFTAPPEEQELVRTQVDDLLRDHIPVELDAYLLPTLQGRATLVRAGRWDLVEKLVAVDADLVGICTATSVEWIGEALHITAEARWSGKGGARLAIRRDGDRIVRDLPAEITAALPPQALDMTAALDAAHASIGIRARNSAVNWMLPSDCKKRIDDGPDGPELVLTVTATLDPHTAIFGRPLDEKSWDVTARTELFGGVNQRGLRTSTPAQNLIRDGHIYIAYKNKTGMLSLDVDQTNRSLTGSAPLDATRATSTLESISPRRLRRPVYRSTFAVPFMGVVALGTSSIEGRVTTRKGSAPAKIVAGPNGVWLESSLEQPPGRYPLTIEFHGRSMAAKIVAVVARDGTLTFSRDSG